MVVVLLGSGDNGGCLTLALRFFVVGNACGTGEGLLLFMDDDDADDDPTMGLLFLRPRDKRKKIL